MIIDWQSRDPDVFIRSHFYRVVGPDGEELYVFFADDEAGIYRRYVVEQDVPGGPVVYVASDSGELLEEEIRGQSFRIVPRSDEEIVSTALMLSGTTVVNDENIALLVRLTVEAIRKTFPADEPAALDPGAGADA